MRIEHIGMYVNNLEAAKKFFVTYFNAKSNELYHNRKTDFQSYFLSFEDDMRLEIMNKPGLVIDEAGDDRTGFIHLAFSAGSREKVDQMTETLARDGYKILGGPRQTGDGYYESCILGIEGCRIELTV